MGSPGDFIHSGTLGGRLSVLVSAATASPPARPPASAPPIRALPSRRKRRREVTRRTESAGCFFVMYPPFALTLDHRYILRQPDSQGTGWSGRLRKSPGPGTQMSRDRLLRCMVSASVMLYGSAIPAMTARRKSIHPPGSDHGIT